MMALNYCTNFESENGFTTAGENDYETQVTVKNVIVLNIICCKYNSVGKHIRTFST